MEINKVFINTYRYDFHFAKICIASVRYWYPVIPVYLIKDENQGKFDTSFTEKLWNIKIFDTNRKKFGWGYGKLEPLFSGEKGSFLILDADTVLTGPVIDAVKDIDADFVVDNEVQPSKRFNEIYYNLDRINELDNDFRYPGYSFNSGQWFGTPGKLSRDDFNPTLTWTEPPVCRFPDIVFKGDQAHLNYTVHRLEQQNKISVSRINLMVWPSDGTADFLDLEKLRNKTADYPLVIHWAGMGSVKIEKLPRHDIISFYKNFYYSRAGKFRRFLDNIHYSARSFERKAAFFIKRFKKPYKNK